MFSKPTTQSSIDFTIMESKIDIDFINLINREVDQLLTNKSKISASGRLVGQIKKGEQLFLSREVKIFDSIHKLGECMAENYTSNYFINANIRNPYNSAKCIDLWSVHQYAGDYNPIHNHSSIHNTKLSFILWTKVPEKMNNSTEDFLFNASGKEDGCTNFIGKSGGNLLDFHPTNNRTYYPEVGRFLIFPSWLNHSVNPFRCNGERRTIAGNITLGEASNLPLNQNDKSVSNIFGSGNPLKWKISQEF